MYHGVKVTAALKFFMSLACLVSMIYGCGSTSRTPQPADQYELRAPLLALKGRAVQACAGAPLSALPTDCEGVEVSGVDAGSVAGAIHYANGAIETPVVRLVGSWDGRRLVVEAPPQVVSRSDSSPLPDCSQPLADGQPTQAVLQTQTALQRDRRALLDRGITILKTGPCGEFLNVVVPVADGETVGYLQGHYPGTRVSGWLTPTRT